MAAHDTSAMPGTAASPVDRAVLGRDWTRTRATGFALVALLLAGWEASARLGWVVSDNWPPFSMVVLAIGSSLLSGELAAVLGASLYRVLCGFAAGCVAGVLAGLLLGASRWLDWAPRPLIEVLRTLPTPAIVPPLILLLGVDDALKIFIAGLAVFFPVFVNTYAGVRSVDETLLLTARTFGLGPVATLRKIVLPAALPSVMAGMRVSLSLALIMTVVAEMISGDSGAGYFLMSMQYALRADMMYAVVICLAAAGYLLNRLFLAVEHRLLHWHVARD